MLEEFREKAYSPDFFEQENEEPGIVEVVVQEKGPFLGMSPVQRFLLSLMLFMIVCLVSSLALLVAEKVVIPL